MKKSFLIVYSILSLTCIIFANNAFAQNTLADAQKAYVAGNWKEAALAYEVACANIADSAFAECMLWNVLALSQTGVVADFSKAGKRLDSLIQKNPKGFIFAELMMTKAQFQLYLKKNDKAAESLIQAIKESTPKQHIVLRKVCSVIQSKVQNDLLSQHCSNIASNSSEIQPVVQVQKSSSSAEIKNISSSSLSHTTLSSVSQSSMPEAQKDSSKDDFSKKELSVKQDSNWYLQLGAFSIKKNAELLTTNLKKRGISCKIEERIGETRTLYLVQIIGFQTKEQAIDFGAQKLAPINVEFQAFSK